LTLATVSPVRYLERAGGNGEALEGVSSTRTLKFPELKAM
jgi:hypothetical protein